MLTSLILFLLLSVAAATYMGSSSFMYRSAQRQRINVQVTQLCDAGVQELLLALWRPFKIEQDFENIDLHCQNANEGAPGAALAGEISGIGRYSAGVIDWEEPSGDTYTRNLVVRCVGWLDYNNNGRLDATEPRKVVDVNAIYKLARSQVFDYTYFVNNYGWMNGFNPNDLIVNGDMRANGNFDFTGGSPTINGSIYAALNEKLSPRAQGFINAPPVKWTNSNYNSSTSANTRARRAYDPSIHGNPGSAEFEKWKGFLFDSVATLHNGEVVGAALADSDGYKSWVRTSSGSTPAISMLDSSATEEVVMPDLSNLNQYITISQNYVNSTQTFLDGTTNPNFGQGAYVEVWDPTLNGNRGAYKRISTNGVVTGSAALIGTSTRPIKIHGPVTFTQDAVIKGYVSGQGTIYTGRNVHIVGSIRYSNPPSFNNNSFEAMDSNNHKRDILALAARGSVIMGNPKGFTTARPLKYMTPPFTKGRYDDNGNWIPPFDANQIDESGMKRYQSTMGDNYLDGISESVNVLDAVLYTNFVGGGNLGTSSGGVTFNGSIISKDEAMVIHSLPMTMNYDSRIRERSLDRRPLIDLNLPRSPVMLRSSWKDRGFSMGS